MDAAAVESAARGSTASSQRRRRHHLFLFLLLLVVVATIELGSWILLRWVPPPALSEVAEVERDHFSDLPPEAQAGISLLQNKSALHPFLGYVVDPVFVAGGDPGFVAGGDPGFAADSGPAPFSETQEYGFSRSKPARIFYPPTEDRVVVGIFGGSVASILATSAEAVLAQELGRAERFAGKTIALVNLGQGGYKQPQQLMALNYFLALGAHLDVVVNVDGFNDVALAPADNARQGVFPFYPGSWYYLSQAFDGSEQRAIGELTYLRARISERATAFAASALRFSPTATLLWRLVDRRLAQRTAAAEQALAEAHDATATSYQTRGPRREYASPAALRGELVDLWQQSSLQMHALCSALGIEYHHFLQPNQYVPGSKPLSAEERRSAFDEDHPYAAGAVAAYPLLIDRGAELRRRGISFHDMTRVFADLTETIYTDKCCHFNGRGNRILGRAIGRAITAAAPGGLQHPARP